jgi:diguanylate cyclase (GGDEF)-like protein
MAAKDSNPLTHLPGNQSIKTRIIEAIDKGENSTIIYCDLNNFKSYNDYYGFFKGDKVIQHTANLIKNVKQKFKIHDYFVGHIGGDDFVIVLPDKHKDDVSEFIIKTFDETIKEYYSNNDLKKNYIMSKNRQNQLMKIPIMGISMAGVSLRDARNLNHFQIIDICSEIKQQCKTHNKSVCIINNRTY